MESEESFKVTDKRSSVSASQSDKPKETSSQPEGADDKGTQPPLTFSTFVLSLSSSAAMSLGGYQDPVSGHIPKNLELAKQSIDILAILHEKTKGNLDDEEKNLLESALYDLRMKYVEEVKKG